MTGGLLLGALVASFVGSLHCAGMCGPLVVFSGAGERPKAGPLAAYHGARIAGYMLLGALAGSLGAAIDLGGQSVGLARFAALLAGVTMVLIGLNGLLGTLAKAPSPRLERLKRRISARVMPVMGRAKQLAPLQRSLWIGGLTALLPCGWLFAFLVVAAGTGSPLTGSLVMLMLGLGSVPVLLGIGIGSSSVLAPLARRSPGVVSGLLLVLGVATITGRFAVPSFAQTMSAETLQERLLSGELKEEALPCCSGADAVEPHTPHASEAAPDPTN